MISSRTSQILADTGYAAMLPGCDLLEHEIRRRFGDKITRLARFSMVRGVLAWWIARDYDFVVTVSHWPGGRWLIFLTAWLGGSRRRKIILLEFISCPERWLNRLAFSIWLPLIFRPAIKRVMVAAQVMAEMEPEYYSRLFGLRNSVFHVIPLPLIEDRVQQHNYDPAERLVFASGRGACDWETLFRAAEGADWDLCVVCSKHDRKRVDRLNLNQGGHASVRSEISPQEHAQMMASAAVYILPVKQRPVSCGQIRMRNAISAGTPIVCTQARGLNGYAFHNETAIVVNVGDYGALRREVDRLLADPPLRQTLATRAQEFASRRTATWFARAIHDFVVCVATDTDEQATARLSSAQNIS